MSYIRPGRKLIFMKGTSKSYVYPSFNGVIDYGDDYKNNESFCELMRGFVWRATEDEKYANKMLTVLATKLGISDKVNKKYRVDLEKDKRFWKRERKEIIRDS